MTRVRYLAALVGSTERRSAPLLRPPRRLFPHELPSVEPLPEPQPAGETGGKPPTDERPAAGPEPAAPEPVREEPLEVLAPVRARSLETPAAPQTLVPRSQEVVRPPVEDTPSAPRREIEEAPQPPAPVTALRAPDPPPPARREARTEPKPVGRDPEIARAPAARRSVATLEPSRTRPRVAASPERVATPARGLHIGSIDVTVAPPPAAPREPALAAPSAAVPRPPATFDPRGASVSRWFGLAQR